MLIPDVSVKRCILNNIWIDLFLIYLQLVDVRVRFIPPVIDPGVFSALLDQQTAFCQGEQLRVMFCGNDIIQPSTGPVTGDRQDTKVPTATSKPFLPVRIF